jgi:hypothetical protein
MATAARKAVPDENAREATRKANVGTILESVMMPPELSKQFHSRKVEWFCVVRGEAAIRRGRV